MFALQHYTWGCKLTAIYPIIFRTIHTFLGNPFSWCQDISLNHRCQPHGGATWNRQKISNLGCLCKMYWNPFSNPRDILVQLLIHTAISRTSSITKKLGDWWCSCLICSLLQNIFQTNHHGSLWLCSPHHSCDSELHMNRNKTALCIPLGTSWLCVVKWHSMTLVRHS